MNSFMSWVGGKKNLRDEVLARFPTYYERYIEVFGGTGLGLSICKLIINRMGGDIRVDSTYSKGARFIFTHPLKQEENR